MKENKSSHHSSVSRREFIGKSALATVEIPNDPAQSQRLGDRAKKHKIGVGYHGHLQQTITAWDVALSQSPYNGLNCDLGHYVAAGFDPLPLLEAKHDRMYSTHLKDRKSKDHGGTNMP